MITQAERAAEKRRVKLEEIERQVKEGSLTIRKLTAKERKVIALVVEGNGASNKELAQRAFVAEHTMRNYLTSIYQKLGVANRLELYVYASKHGLEQQGG